MEWDNENNKEEEEESFLSQVILRIALELAWHNDIDTDIDTFCDHYFFKDFGPFGIVLYSTTVDSYSST
jgi:hypothetical protein